MPVAEKTNFSGLAAMIQTGASIIRVAPSLPAALQEAVLGPHGRHGAGTGAAKARARRRLIAAACCLSPAKCGQSPYFASCSAVDLLPTSREAR